MKYSSVSKSAGLNKPTAKPRLTTQTLQLPYSTFFQDTRNSDQYSKMKFIPDTTRGRIVLFTVIAIISTGIGLTAFFLQERPVNVEEGETTINSFDVIVTPTPTFILDLSVSYKFENLNYFDIEIDQIDSDIIYKKKGVKIGTVTKSSIKLPSRQTITTTLRAVLDQIDSTTLNDIFNDISTYGVATFDVKGKAYISALIFKQTRDIDQTVTTPLVP